VSYAIGRTLAGKPRHSGRLFSEEEKERRTQQRNAGKVLYNPTAFDAPGLAQHDVLDYGQSLNLESAKLDDVAAEVLNSKKVDMPYEEMFTILQGRDVTSWSHVAIYCLRDAELPLDIMVKKRQVQFVVQIASVCNISLGLVCAGGQQKRLTSMVYDELYRRGVVFNEPTKLDFVNRPWLFGGGEKVKGATVLETVPGWYRDPVVTCDYTSLYPSIIVSRNLCPSKLLIDETAKKLSESTTTALGARVSRVKVFEIEERDSDLVNYVHVLQTDGDDDIGVLPRIANTLLDQRDVAKRDKADANKMGDSTLANILDAKQQALKVICNSLYGGLNAIMKGALYCRPLGGVVTSEGRKAIVAIQDSVRSVEDCTIVAGDTDSVMFLLKGRTLDEAAKVGCMIAEDVNRKLHIDGAKAMSLAYEKTMLPALFVKRKNYCYIKHEPSKVPEKKSMGLMSKKRGTAAIFKTAFIDIENAYLLDPAVFPRDCVVSIIFCILRDLVVRLNPLTSGRHTDEATKTQLEPLLRQFVNTALLRGEETYADGYNACHVNAARRYIEAKKCAWPTNVRLPYVHTMPPACLKKSEIRVSDHSMHYDLFTASDSTAVLNLMHYLQNVTERYVSLLQFAIPDIKQRFDRLQLELVRKNLKQPAFPIVRSETPFKPPSPLVDACSRGDLQAFWTKRLEEEASWTSANHEDIPKGLEELYAFVDSATFSSKTKVTGRDPGRLMQARMDVERPAHVAEVVVGRKRDRIEEIGKEVAHMGRRDLEQLKPDSELKKVKKKAAGKKGAFGKDIRDHFKRVPG
jgi:hypothetical protein